MNELSPVAAPPLPASPPPLPPTPVFFTGDRSDFFRLVRRGALLELLTFGFYRFWLVTDMRRQLWAHTEVAGDSAEYTGRGRELLIGFLIAIAILAPVYLGYFLISIEAERYKGFASIPLVIAFYAFGQFAIFRARRYRLTRTVWRGVRFWMTGSGWAYALRASLWGALALVTLGITMPWREAALERYKMAHTHYGDLQGRFEGRGWDLFRQIWWMWLVAPLAMIIFPLAPFVYARFKALEWRWWISGIRFGEVRLDCKLAPDALLGLYWKAIGWAALMSTLLGIYVTLASVAVVRLSGTSVERAFRDDGTPPGLALVVLTVIGYLVVVLALNVVMRVYLVRDVWARVLVSTGVHGIGAATDVVGRGELANALGEGFADGLDVGGF